MTGHVTGHVGVSVVSMFERAGKPDGISDRRLLGLMHECECMNYSENISYLSTDLCSFVDMI